MSIRPGSSQYFDTRTKDITKIALISNTDISKGLRKIGARIAEFFRRPFKASLTTSIQGQIRALNEKLTGTGYYQDCPKARYAEVIDNFVVQQVNEMQAEVFEKFSTDALVTVLQKAKGLSDSAHVQLLKQYPELTEALNDIQGNIKLKACQALKRLPELLEDIPLSGVATFDTPITDLKKFYQGDSPEKQALVNNLDAVTKAMANWKAHWKGVEDFIDPKNKDRAGLELIEAWAIAMKGQRQKIQEAIPKNYDFKKHGYFAEQIDEVKRIIRLQQAEIKSPGKLKKSLATFMASQARDVWQTQRAHLAELKKDWIGKCLAEIKKCEEEKEKRGDDPLYAADVIALDHNKQYHENRLTVYQAYWTDLNMDAVRDTAKTNGKMAKKLMEKVSDHLKKGHMSKCATRYRESMIGKTPGEIAMLRFEVQCRFSDFMHDRVMYKIPEVKSGEDVINITKRMDQFIRDIDTITAILKQESVVKGLLFNQMTVTEALMYFQGVREGCVIAKKNANIRLDEIELELIAATAAQGQLVAAGQADDKAFIDSLTAGPNAQFVRVDVSNDGNCFFYTFHEWLKDSSLDAFKAFSPEQLRTTLYQYLEDKFDDYISFGNTLAEAVQDYAKASDSDAQSILSQTAPKLRDEFIAQRESYQKAASKNDWFEALTTKYGTKEWCTTYAKAMADTSESKTFVDFIEVYVMALMLNVKVELHCQIYGNKMMPFNDKADIPVVHILRPKNLPHYDLLKPKAVTP